MENKAAKKLLFITGAGASASLTKKDSPIYFYFSYGKYQTLPLGEELIGRIIAYKSKSLCWLLSLFCWRLVNNFERDWQTRFFDFAKKVEEFWLSKQETIKEIFSKESDRQNGNFLKEKLGQKNYETFRETFFFTLLENSQNNTEHLIKQNNILTEEFLEDLWNKISNIFRNLDRLLESNKTNNLDVIKNTIDGVGIYEKQNHRWKEAKEKILKSTSSEENYDVAKGLENLINLANKALIIDGGIQSSFHIEGLFGIRNDFEARNYNSLINENVRQNIINFKQNLLQISQNFKSEAQLLWFEEILNCFEKDSLNENRPRLINPFDQIVKEAQKIRSQILKEVSPTCGDLTNQNFISAIEHLKKFFTIASIIEHYRPYSIDYFMMNLRQLAPFEFFDSAGKKLGKKATKEREKEIQKYTKFIIAECLGNSALFGKFEAQYQDNYFRRLRWKILENAFFYYRDKERKNAFEKYLKNDVKIITFNYENSLDLIAFESLGLEAAKNFLRKNVSHVYGSLELKVYLKENGGKSPEKKSNWSKNALFKSLFDDCERTKLFPEFFGDNKEYSCTNIFEQIDKSIKWIGEKDNPEKIAKAREKHQQQFNEADEIYFLGFGFDSENLYRLGIINKNQQLENSLKLHGKKILISGASPKITSGVRKIFKTTEQIVDATLTTLSKPDLGFEILLSSKFLPEALSQDL